jgi:serine/threonine-protein kinase haspin
MHNGNICVRSITPNGTIEVPDHQLSTWSENQTMHLGLTGMRLTLIDYTLSRARLEDNSIAFQDLKDIKFLFTRPGQQPASIQQRAYDQMRDAVRAASASNTSTSKKEDWSLSVPRTNIVWLYYLLTLFLEHDLWVPEASNAACLRAQDAMRTKLESVLVGLEAGATGEGACFGSAGELLEGVLESGLLGREEVEGYVKQLESEQ